VSGPSGTLVREQPEGAGAENEANAFVYGDAIFDLGRNEGR
jgi:hypothetical protein